MTTSTSFLVEGAKSYFDAIGAIGVFERAVCNACRSVYDKHKSELVEKIGLKAGPCQDHDSNKHPEDGIVELGVFQPSASGRDDFYVYIRWDGTRGDAPEISAEICLEFSRKGDRNEYAKLLQKSPFIQPVDEWDFSCLWTSKKLADLSGCAEALDEQLNGWLSCWPAGRKLK